MRPAISFRFIVSFICFLSGLDNVVCQNMKLAKGALEESRLPKSGTLILSGGEAPTADMLAVLSKVAGDELVYIPGSSKHDARAVEKANAVWKSRGFSRLTFLHAASREEAERPEFCTPLATAKRVFISGGTQEFLMKHYHGTPVVEALRGVLNRGGVICGTSAGMAILPTQAIYDEIVVHGKKVIVEGPGFGFFPGLADTHFEQRQRFDRMDHMRKLHQDMYGLGVNATAAVALSFHEDRIEGTVLGESAVYLYPPRSVGETEKPLLMTKESRPFVLSIR